MSPRGRPASMPPSLSASGPISVAPRSSPPPDSSRSARARSASGLMCTREPLPSGCLRQLSSHGARRIGADTGPAGRPVGDACARTPRVPSPSRRRRTFRLPVAPTRANVDRRPPPVAAGKEDPRPWTHTTRLGQPAPRSPARRHRPRAHSALKGRPWGTSSTPTSRTTRCGSSDPRAPLAGGPPISPPSSAAPHGAATLTTYQIRQYQLTRRAAGAATGTINRETSALHRMCALADHWGWLDIVPGFPDRLRENPPRQGFFEHPEYLAVRAHLPAPWQDILDLAYYSGWRKQEILGLTWEEIDMAGGVIRLSPARSKTLVGRILPISQPIADALARRRARRDPDSPLVFHRDGIPVRRWRTAWRTACQSAGVPTRFLHDCRRTAARNLIRANVPERVAMLLTGHKSRAIFDRYNIINEQELLDAGDQLVEYLAQQAQAVPARRRPHPAGPATPHTASPLRLVRRTTA